MDPKILNFLRCPECLSELSCKVSRQDFKKRIQEGSLDCSACQTSYPIIRGIPRFVALQTYADSFGYQWTLFNRTQLDSYSKLNLSAKRFWAETGWKEEDLENNWVLDAGCGSGRFLEICAETNCQIVGIDMSCAIDAAGELFKNRSNVHLIQASLDHLPFAHASFDKCYCIGVIQHTADPGKCLSLLPKFVKNGGKLAFTIYEKKPWTKFYGKYMLRIFTKRMNKKILLSIIKIFSPILFPLTEVLFRVPYFKKIFQFLIPYANYVDSDLNLGQRYTWAILDTFDMLSPSYDIPLTENFVRSTLEKTECKNIKRLNTAGLNLIANIVRS